MSSRFAERARLALTCMAAIAALGSCKREAREFHQSLPPASVSAESMRVARSDSGVSREGPDGGNAYALQTGKQLYVAFNCIGCHSHGGGGMGPPLMDTAWIYGYDPANIYATIANGRPNGMPSFRNRITPTQIWELVAYVRALSGQGSKAARPNRNDEMEVKAAESQTTTQNPVIVIPPPPVSPPVQEKP